MSGRIHRTTIDLDLDKLDLAREELGTTTIRETVDRALDEVVRRAGLRELAEMVRAGTLNVPSPEQLAEMRRNPHFP